jgi:hypothetical protein
MKINTLFLFFGFFIIASIIFLIFLPTEYSNTVVGFLGIFIGGLISSVIQYFNNSSQFENNLRLASLDKRLQAHQDAFYLWSKLMADLFDAKNIQITVSESQNWWNKNCIYLSPEASNAFKKAYMHAIDHLPFTKTGNVDLVEENFKDITEAGNIILQGVLLPPISPNEYKYFQNGE